MAYKLLVTEKAESDLDAIFAYIVHTLCNVQAASDLADAIDERYALLAETPRLYGECRQSLLRRQHSRKAVVGGYLVVYRVDDEKRTVYADRFFSDLQEYADKL